MISNLYADDDPRDSDLPKEIGERASGRAHVRNARRYLSDLEESRDVVLLSRAGLSVREVADVTTLTPYRVRQVVGGAVAGQADRSGLINRPAEEGVALAAVEGDLDDPDAVTRLVDRLVSVESGRPPSGVRAGDGRGDPVDAMEAVLRGVHRARDRRLVTVAQLLRLTCELERRGLAGGAQA